MGVSRDTFYCYQAVRDAGGVEPLFDVSCRKPNLKNRKESAVDVHFCNLHHMAYGLHTIWIGYLS